MRRSFNNKLHQIINESVKDALNEVSWQTSARASKAASDREFGYNSHTVFNALDTVREYLSQFREEDYLERTQAAKLMRCVDKIIQFVQRKNKQRENLEDLDYDNFKKQHNGVDKYKFGDDVENTEEEDWTPSQREYADFYL